MKFDINRATFLFTRDGYDIFVVRPPSYVWWKEVAYFYRFQGFFKGPFKTPQNALDAAKGLIQPSAILPFNTNNLIEVDFILKRRI